VFLGNFEAVINMGVSTSGPGHQHPELKKAEPAGETQFFSIPLFFFAGCFPRLLYLCQRLTPLTCMASHGEKSLRIPRYFTGTVPGCYRNLCLHHHTAHNTYCFPGKTMDNQQGSIRSGNRGSQQGSRTYNSNSTPLRSRRRCCS
jgi:hypothetical protein